MHMDASFAGEVQSTQIDEVDGCQSGRMAHGEQEVRHIILAIWP